MSLTDIPNLIVEALTNVLVAQENDGNFNRFENLGARMTTHMKCDECKQNKPADEMQTGVCDTCRNRPDEDCEAFERAFDRRFSQGRASVGHLRGGGLVR
jgi:hypothetical protein